MSATPKMSTLDVKLPKIDAPTSMATYTQLAFILEVIQCRNSQSHYTVKHRN